MMTIQDITQKLVESGRGVAGRARTETSDALGHVPEVAGEARHRAEQVAEKLPEAFGEMRLGAQSGVTKLQTVPDSGLRLMVAVSLGISAGLLLAGKPRLAALAGLVPAAVIGFAILSRPQPVNPEPKPIRP
jgi:hypothetical protein